ncbi:aminotransferase class I/II-fold pyridoxal phosphate-dependent enzyme [Petroclostridium sp. X23]|uniref:aminotransferase class I/II-fold pyridoxal phosphate-dependent enzyme n=1 Tax=Petroclostridium sp. X23 TaxID=3045146 RepID=UPI0024ACC8D1|nr:aminotransferase class I/II-fold pyridoxal phosphate-dependent enzyme [Petroclostridium sp. X23]WHH58433.1 aminotransferase class I/II-fold pyridoxal phosphate-dependent enzyme [Petroclostridium sp. X23]
MIFSKRMGGLTSAIFSELESKKNELFAQGREVINFSIGTPDMPPAPHVIQAIRESAEFPGNYVYAINDRPELIQAVIQWYDRRFQVQLEPEEITSMMGSQDGLAHIALTLADPGDIVMVPDPGYPIFSIGPSLACATLHRIPLFKENNFLMDLDAIDSNIAHKAKMMVVSYPNNPVAVVAPPEFYEKLVWFAKKYDIVVVHDNAYCELTFDGIKGGSFLSIPGAKDVGIEFNSLSKSYNIPGCRISFAMGNKKVIEQLRILKSHMDYGVFLPIQYAAIAALSGPQDCLRQTVQTYERRRDILIDGLQKIGWKVDKPSGTMFVWAPIPKAYSSSVEFTFDLLDKTGVMVVPGSSFGEMGEGYVRIALVQSEEKILRAIELIKESGILG